MLKDENKIKELKKCCKNKLHHPFLAKQGAEQRATSFEQIYWDIFATLAK